MLQDIRYGLKLLWKEKTFTITALATLALCIRREYGDLHGFECGSA